MVAQAVERDVGLYAQQFDFVEDDHRFVAFIGGRGSGKTYAGSWKAANRAMRGELGIIAAPNFPMLEFGAKRAFVDRLEEMRMPYVYQGQKGLISIPGTGAEVRFATLENESRVRGPNYAWAWLDEFEYLADAGVWRALKGSVRAGAKPQIFGTSTPKGRRLAYQEWVVGGTEQHALYRASSYDNRYIDAEAFVRSLGYTGAFLEQEVYAQFVGFEGLVWPQFRREFAVRAVDAAGWRAVLGVDIGTRNPTAILTVRRGGDARHVEAEVYRAGLSSEEIITAIEAAADRVSPDAILLDPSGAGYITTLRQHGYPARKANNEVAFGIGRVATAFADGMTIDPSCVNLISELESYHYPDNRTEVDKPVKELDHACDALRYAIASESAPIPLVAAGSVVGTYFGRANLSEDDESW
jgi:phage terminase large subunit-like protein